MQPLHALWQRIKNSFQTFTHFLKRFYEDVSDQFYKKTVDRAAAILLIVFFGLFLFVAGGDTLDYLMRNLGKDSWALRDRQLTGQVRDADGDFPLPDVAVGAVDHNQPPISTEADGTFILQFRAHKDSTFFSLSLSKPGYIPKNKRYAIPLNPEAERKTQYFTLKKKD